MRPRCLLINPWIYDFAAFDLWAKPLGLLYLTAILRRAGADVQLVDCLDRLKPGSGARPSRAAWPPGAGQWARQVIPLPAAIEGLPRHWARYGQPVDRFLVEISVGPPPDLILITSGMTYWYPGVAQAAQLLRQTWPKTPIILGGIYASLCPDHARRIAEVDLVIAGPGEGPLPELVREFLKIDIPHVSWTELRPEIELYPRLDFAPLLTSRGCPGNCPYCASHRLFSRLEQRRPESVIEEILDRKQRLGLTHFTFFDDALLVNPEEHLLPILEAVIRQDLKIRLHAPNGLHLRAITPELARLMFAAGFETIRLGLESLDPDRRQVLGPKVVGGEFEAAVACLKAAGFGPKQVGAYILWGLPGQPLREVLGTVAAVKALGVRPYLAEYSPLPGTSLWSQALLASPFDIENEPLFQNNSFFPCRGPDFSWPEVWAVKRSVNEN